MDGVIVLLIVLCAFLGAPLFAIFGAAALVLFAEEGTITSVATDVFSERFSDSPMLVTLPLFTFAGYMLAESGTPNRIVRLSRAFFGALPGGLAMVCIVASAWFTIFTGGSGITIVAIGGLLFPALLKDGYPKMFSLGLVTTGGSLGLIFPPSIPLVLYAVVAQILIDKVFLAGVIPGALTVLLMMAYAAVVGWRNMPKETRGSFGMAALRLLLFITVGWFAIIVYKLVTSREARSAFLEAIWELLIPVVLLFTLWAGSISEAAAVVALYALFIEVVIYRDIKITTDLPRVIRESMTMLGAILAILVTALGFTGYLIDAEVPQKMVVWMSGVTDSPIVFLIALNIFLLIVGMLMDIFSAIVVVVPLLVLPAGNSLADHFGIDPYHLAIIFLLNLEIGYLTPPVGLNLFISSFRFREPVTVLYRAVLPFIGILVVALLATTYIPFLSTWLPSFREERRLTEEDIQGPAGGGGGEVSPDDGAGTLENLDSGDTLDTLDTLDDLGPSEGETLDDLAPPGGETLDDLAPPTPAPAPSGAPVPGETLDDL
jgi:tripartite ATP-independent transporter DctM subunit